jgi:predicted lipid-binding transport protein (Tim44 family)
MGDGGFQFIDIIFLAMVAGFVALRLRSVLGRRTGEEAAPPADPFRRPERVPDQRVADQRLPDDRSVEGRDEVVVPLPGRGAQRVPGVADAQAAQGVAEIQVADRSFEVDSFISGARWAYEIVVNAFAAGDTETLKPLVSDEVFRNFTDALEARKASGNTVETSIAAIKGAEIVGAALRGRVAEVTVRFVSDLVSVTRNPAGNVVEGHPTAPREVTDIWTFSRDTRSRDPNWTLIATATPT